MNGTPEEYLPVYFRHHEYYLDYYRSYCEGKKHQFNIAAFFVTGYWLIYRKMYVYAVLYHLGWIIIQGMLLMLLVFFQVTNLDSFVAWQIVVGLVLSIVCGFLGNRIYMAKALREIQKTVQNYPRESDRLRKLRTLGGTSFWFAIVLILEILLLDVTN